jgi:flavin reductase (DIM6/NTAB) family NADH-FMN oxidoreductase RutF
MERIDFSHALMAVKHPQKVVIAFVQSEENKFNPITLEWFMRTSIEPPMFAISIGHTRFSYKCLQNYRNFNLCFPNNSQGDFVRLSGTKSGRDIDKMNTIEGEWFKGRYAGLPIMKEAVANFECEVITQVSSGDHTIYVGKVKYSWVDSTKDIFTLKDL